jgi:hypothetical protein
VRRAVRKEAAVDADSAAEGRVTTPDERAALVEKPPPERDTRSERETRPVE